MRNTTLFNCRKKILFHIVITTIISSLVFRQLSFLNENDYYLVHNPRMTTTKVTSRNDNQTITTIKNDGTLNETNNTLDIQKCFDWEDNSDEWVIHHPTWEVSLQNDTHVCFHTIDTPRTRFLKKVYENQWYGDCSKVYTGPMWNSGWGATFGNVANGLLKGLGNQRPFQIKFEHSGQYWMYATLKNNNEDNSACPTKDMFCYFLPLTNCSASKTILKGKNAPGYGHVVPTNSNNDYYYTPWRNRRLAHRYWLQQYATRPQHYLRKKLYNFLQQNMTNFQTPCIAIHVRRSDVILDRSPRKYYSIANYLQNIPPKFQKVTNLFLLTDDANAIDEALEFHPEYNWMFTQKQRYRGSEGGVQNHIPSQNPPLEVLYILAELELVKMCDLLIGSISGFSDLIHAEMKIKQRTIPRINVENNKQIIYNMKNAKSEEELNQYLKHLRNNKTLNNI